MMTLSPTTSILRALLTLATALALGLLLTAPGIVHAGHGMPDGPERTVALVVGGDVLPVAEVFHLDAPWNAMQAALGRGAQPDVPPLLATTPHSRLVQTGRTGGPARRKTHAIRPRSSRSAPIRLPTPTARNPLRLLVTGDSQTEFMGPDLINAAAQTGVVTGSVDTHYGTGLARPDYVDWSLLARQQVAHDRPQAVVVFMGGNDNQNLMLANGRILYTDTAAWTREYQRRAEVCMRIWVQSGRARVYWLSVPPARDPAWAAQNARMNVALRRAAAGVPGVRYLDILGPVTNHGRYVDYLDGILMRAPDGFHLTEAGSQIVAGEVLPVLKHDWHIR